MADDTDTQVAQAQAPPPPDLSNLSQTDLANALRTLQAVPPVTVDQTPVDRSWTSKIGEFLGGGGGPGAAALSPAQKEAAGSQALRDFGIHLMLASHYVPGQTLFSNLGQGLLGAEQSYQGQEQQAAGVLASKQGYQQEQQQMNIQRIKAALPLLSLQAQQAAGQKALQIGLGGGGGGAPGTNVGTGGSVGQVNVPPEYLPFYQAASARTGIPVETLIAQSRQESGFNPNATGKAGEIGIAQVMPATAKSPGFGMAGVDPKALRDPETAINFQADYLKAHLPKGADPTDPVAIAKALQGYNGGGDPNYVANVNRYLPGARAALASPPRPGAQPTAASPPPVVGARPVLPPPQPAIAPNAGAQVAGPAAPTSGVIPPSPPGSAGDVATIRGAMVGAGANPVTLAPGSGSAPAPQGTTVVAGTPQATTPPTPPPQPNPFPDIKAGDAIFSHPGERLPFLAANTTPPPTTGIYATTLTPAEENDYQNQMKAVAGLPGSAEKIQAIMAARQAAVIARENQGLKAQGDFAATDRAAVQSNYDKRVDAYQKAADAQQTSANKIAEQASQSGFDINKAGREVSFKTDTETLKNLATNASVAASVNPQLEQLGTVTPGALPPGITASIVKAHPDLVPFLTQLGALTPEQATDTQLMQGMTNMLSTELRPKGSGRLLLPEIDAFKSDLPNLLQQPGGRIKAAAFLKNLNDRSQEESDFANQYFKRIDPATGQPAFNLDGLPKALAQPRSAGGLGPIVPPMPPLATLTGDPAGPAAAATNWLKQNVEVGRPYMGWQYPLNPRTQQPDPTQPPELHLMVREK